MKTIVIRAILLISGAMAVMVGAALLLAPVAFEASAGITLPADPSLLSEMRAPGGALLVGGLFIGAGALRLELASLSAALSAVLYLSYGASRLLGLALDGPPSSSLILVTALELAIGLAALGVLRGARDRRLPTSSGPLALWRRTIEHPGVSHPPQRFEAGVRHALEREA
ncbi:MAG: DUF4345 domain-containing protein [Myxococcales bacterium]|nr:DUF4345 domain-containing protein [Myxococcales bacterium]